MFHNNIANVHYSIYIYIYIGPIFPLRFTIRRKINYVSCEGGIKYISLPCFGLLFPEIFCIWIWYPPNISAVHVAESLVFCVVLCGSLFGPLSFFFSPLYCLSFFNLRLLIIPEVSSNLFNKRTFFKTVNYKSCIWLGKC